MRYEDASLSGSFQDQGPVARDDTDQLAAGDRGPATGNVITGAGTQTGAAGADTGAGARLTAVSGAGGQDNSFAGGQLRVEGEHGTLSVTARGDYVYRANAGVPENSRDTFNYTLSDAAGATSQARLVIEIGKTQAVVAANAQRVVPGPDGVVVLPAGVELSDIRIVGRDLLIMLPDGSQMLIVDGAVFVPQLVINDIEVPSSNLAALLIEQEPRPASGVPQSSGGNFANPVGPLDPGTPLGDLLPPTQLEYTPPEFQEVFDLEDLEPEVGLNPLIQMDDDVRAGGNAGGTGDDPDAVNTSGILSGSGGDGQLTFALLTTGAPAGFTYVAGQNGSLLVQQNGTTVLTVTVNAQTGAYSVVQNAPVVHANGADENNVVFTFGYTVTDRDGDSATGSFQVNVDDDTPLVDVVAGADAGVTLTTDDADTRGPASDTVSSTANFSGVFSLPAAGNSVGADGLGAAAVLTYALGTPGGASGLTQGGVAINLFLVGNQVVGSTATTAAGITDANKVFDLSVSNTGVVTLTQYSQIDHAPEATTTAPFNDQLISLADNLVTLTASASVTDRDNDSASDSASVQIGANIRFTDDGPSLAGAQAGAGVTLDETQAGTPAGFPISATSASAVIVAGAANFGADGPAASGSTSYAISVVGNGATTLRTAQGDFPITLVQAAGNSNVITGTYDGGKVAFTVTINANGTLTVSQNVPLEHNVDGLPGAAHDDSLDLSGLINATVTVRDFDGDTASASAAIGGLIVFKDDGPDAGLSASGKPQLILDETREVGTDTTGGQAPNGLASASVDVGSAFVAVDYGADGAGSTSYALVLNGSNVSSGLFALGANGEPGAPILLNLVNGQIVGSAGGQTYFTVSLNGSTLTFAQSQAIYHGDTGSFDEAAVLNLAANTLVVRQTVTDSDGDIDTADLDLSQGVFQIQDDGPTARVDGSVAVGTVVLDESEPDGTDTAGGAAPGGLDSGTLALGANFFGNAIDYGSDGAGSVSYALTVRPAVQGGTVGSGLFALQPGDTATGDGDGYGQGAEIQLVQVSATEVAGRVGGTTYFTLTINASGTVTFTQLLPIWNPIPGASYDELASLVAAGGQLLAQQTITDRDGDSSTAEINLSNGVFGIQDDGPTVTAEAADRSVGEGGTVSGAFTFEVGEDGGGITAVNGSAVTFTNGQAVIVLDKGTLTLQSNGSYSFQANNPAGGAQTVTITITDGDGDTVTTDLVLTVTDLNAPTAGAASATVDDDGLVANADAPANGEPGDVNANIGDLDGLGSSEASFRGNLNASFGGDGAGSISFTAMANTTAQVGTETVRYTLSQDGLTLTAVTEGGSRSGTALFSVTLDGAQSTGYTVTLLDNVLHAPGGNEAGTSVTPAISFTITDSDGSSATGSLGLAFNDDIPVAALSTLAKPTLVLDETRAENTDTSGGSAPAGRASVTVQLSGNFAAADYGADGQGAAPAYALQLSGQNAGSGLYALDGSDTSTADGDGYGRGAEVLLSQSGNTITGAVGGTTYFTITVNPATGALTFTQVNPIWHPTAGASYDEAAILNAALGTIQLIQTITDGDGDTATASLDLSQGVFQIQDDGPDATNNRDEVGSQGSTATGNVITGVGTVTSGADDPGEDQPARVTQIVGTGGTDTSFDANGNLVINGTYGTLTINAAGEYSYVRTSAQGGGLSDTFTYTYTDADGDTDTAQLIIDLSNSVPTAGTVSIKLDDDVLANGNPGGPGDDANSEASSNVLIGSGGDGALVFSFAPANQQPVIDGITYGGDSDTLLISQNGVLVITLQITNTATGAYTITQNAPISHGSNGVDGLNFENNLLLNGIKYLVTDANSDVVTGTINIDVDDDTPIARADIDTAVEGGTATGNVLTGAGTVGGSASGDSPGADGYTAGGGVIGVRAAGSDTSTAVTGGTGTNIAGLYGTLTLNADGSYSYKSNPGSITAAQSDVFVYSIRDADGDVTTTTLTINIADVTLVADSEVVLVNEAALDTVVSGSDVAAGSVTGSNAASPAETQTGTLTVPGATSFALVGSGTGALGTLVLNSNGSYTYTLRNPVDGVDANNSTNTVTGAESFQYVATDANGNSVTGTIRIDVIDDVPTARADTDALAAGSFGPETGNVITGSGTTSGNAGVDTPGADGASVTFVSGFNGSEDGSFDANGNLVVNGQYGVLTIKADGSYSYVRNAGTPGGVDDVFTYRLVDGDGDQSSSTLTISLGDNRPVAGASTARVDDDGLAGGNPGGTGDTDANQGETPTTNPSEAIFNGVLAGTAGDGASSFLFAASLNGQTAQLGTETVTYAVSQDGLTLTASSAARGTVFTVAITDAASGAYTLTLVKPVLHDTLNGLAGDNTENDAALTIPFQMRDVDGDLSTVPGSLNVTFNDDTPEAFSPTAVVTTNGNTAPVTGQLNLDMGADGLGSLTFASSLNGQVAKDQSGNILTVGGQQLTYVVNGNILTAQTAGGVVGYRVTLNSDGSYTFDVEAQISNGTETSFTNLSGTRAGNVEYTGIGANDPNTTVDVLLSASSGNAITSVNTDSDSIGAANQSMDSNETVRFDFVQNLVSGGSGPSGFSYGAHVGTTSFSQTIPQVQGSQNNTVSFQVFALDTTNTSASRPDSTADGVFSDSTKVGITTVRIVDGATGQSASANLTTAGQTVTVGFGVTAVLQSDGSVIFNGIQQGDRYGIGTGSTEFDAVVVKAMGSFDLGIFSIGSVSAGTPIIQTLPVIATDADGDSVTASLTATINPASAGTATTSSTARTTEVSSSMVVDDSSDNLRTSASNTNLALMAGLAAGFASMPAAATSSDDSMVLAAGQQEGDSGKNGKGRQNSKDDAGTRDVSGIETSEQGSTGGAKDDGEAQQRFAGAEKRSDEAEPQATEAEAVSALDKGTDAANDPAPASLFGGGEIHLPDAAQIAHLATINARDGAGKGEHGLGSILSDALAEAGLGSGDIDRLIDAAVRLAEPTQRHQLEGKEVLDDGDGAAPAALATPLAHAVSGWDGGDFGPLFNAASAAMESKALHPDAVQPIANG